MRLLLGNFKGPKGEQGPQGQKGNTGDIGQRGSRCTSGTSVTGTSTTGTIFASTGITDSLLHDFYINTSTGNLYECTVPGPADVAKWTYICNIKGPTGATGPAGPTGSISDINNQKPTYTEAANLANISSGETVKIAFGKLKKAISVLMTHYTQQATAAVLGHVKLSNSSAVTQTGLMALDAVEKNAAIAGTLANQISQANSKLVDGQITLTSESDIEFLSAKALKRNGIVSVHISLLKVPNNINYFQITTLPVGYRPKISLTIPIVGVPIGSTDVYLLRADFNSYGGIYITNYSGRIPQEVYIDATFIAS